VKNDVMARVARRGLDVLLAGARNKETLLFIHGWFDRSLSTPHPPKAR
jgi:hypothetical protein